MTTINSVLGPLDTSDLGFTLMHEHIMVASAGVFRDYPELLGANLMERVVDDLKKAKEIQLRLITANAAVTSQYGIAGLKAALDLIGMYGGPVRPPLLPLQEQQRSDLKRILEEADLL